MEDKNNIIRQDIVQDMQTSFLDYSMSVIVARALPDVRDGLKPVHRRIIHSMNDLGITADKAYKKSARIVGEVIGKYHPHGDVAVYDAMVRMAQDFSYRYPLVQGHGNFGSMDGDGAAAMRYTEARMSKIAMEMIKDINKDTVDFIPNYDGEEKEPTVLPARFPNLLVNGTTGIAVGMATNIPPHNLGETIDATIALMENPDISIVELMNDYIKGPDFPTGGIILGRSGIKQAYETGRGSITTRSRVDITHKDNGKAVLTITEIPYQINKAQLVSKIADLVRDKQIEGITSLNDYSNRDGIQIVIELRKDIQPEVVLNQLYRLTPLQSSFGVNNLALVNGAPKQLSLKETLNCYIDHQIDVTVRRTKFELKKAEARAHILEGLKIALDNIDEIIELIRHSKDDNEASTGLIERFKLSETQAKAILEMQLRRLTGLQREKIEEEYKQLIELIADLKDILANHDRVLVIIKEELLSVKERYGDERKTEISDAEMNIEDEDLIPEEEVVITTTTTGYIKRIPLDVYRSQRRGGRGVIGMSTHEDDNVESLLTMSTHDHLLIFTNLGKVYQLKGYQVPAGSRTSKGIPIINLLNLSEEEKISALVPLKRDNEDIESLFFVTANGIVKKVNIDEVQYIRQNGKKMITLREDDELISVKPITAGSEVIIAGTNGKAIRFNTDGVRSMGRSASGVKGFNTDGGKVVGMATSDEGHYLLSVSEKGYGKLSDIDDYRLSNRGGKGVITMNITDKTGGLVSFRAVNGDEDLMIMTSEGVIIRTPISSISVYGRNSQGVKLINLNDDAKVIKIAVASSSEEESEDENND